MLKKTKYESCYKEMILTMMDRGEAYIIIPNTSQIIPTTIDLLVCECKQRSVITATTASSIASAKRKRTMIT